MHQLVAISGMNTIMLKQKLRQWVMPTLVTRVFYVIVLEVVLVYNAPTLQHNSQLYTEWIFKCKTMVHDVDFRLVVCVNRPILGLKVHFGYHILQRSKANLNRCMR